MNHLDEGTIHAWIDGAVDATRSREIEAHVRQCASCAAAVAEARGLVAGASRILNALDDVPAGVVPKRAPVARRQWRAAPWVTGIAAALVLAIGVSRRDSDPTPAASSRRMLAESATVSPPTAQAETLTRPPMVASAPTAQAAVDAAAPRRPALEGKQSAAVGSSRADGSRGSRVASRDAAVSEQSAADAVAGKVAGVSVANANTERRMEKAPVAAPLGASSPTSLKLESVVVTGALESRLRDAPATVAAQHAGCYRLEEATRVRLRSALPTAAEVVGRAAAGAKRAAPAPSAPAPARAQADYVNPAPPAMVRLDTLEQPLGFLVKAISSDSTIGWWREVPGDSARVDLLARGVFTLARKDRVACP
jgi:hypothetical protein